VGLFGDTDPRTGAGVTMVSIPELLKKADERVSAMSDQPSVQARMWHRLGAIHFERSEVKRAFELYERALAAGRNMHITDEARAELLLDHARALREIGRTKDSEAETRDLLAALEASVATKPALLARTLQELGEMVGGDEGLALVERSLAMRRRLVPAQPLEVAASLHSLAVIERRRDNKTRAREIWHEALAIMEKEKGFDNPETRAVAGGLALVLDDLREEEAIHRRILQSVERQLGPEAKGLAFAWNNLGVLLAQQKRYAEAEGPLREAQRRWLATLGPTHPLTQRNLGSIARTLDLAGRPEESLALYREVRRRRAAGGPEAPPMIPVTVSEAEVLIRLGQLDEAEQRLKNVQKDLAAGPAGSLDAAGADVAVGRLRLAQGNAAAATEALRRAVALRERLVPPDSELLAEARCELGRALIAGGEAAEGKKLLTTSLPRFKAWRAAHPADVTLLLKSLD
jgi:tetratricopeptide (TPR) repeat protein